MKRIFTLISFSFILSNCFSQGTWSQKTPCTGSPRYRAIAFEVNGVCYMGTGSTGGGISLNRTDIWAYDVAMNSWTQKANLTGPPRTNATASSDGSYGYVGLGSNNNTLLNDWWQFDPVANAWQAKASFPGVKRFGAEGFSLVNKVFIGGGLDSANNPLADFYAYDPAGDTWTQKSHLPIGVSSAATFTIGTKGYFVSGAINGSVACTTQTAEYDPGTDMWTTKAPYAAGNTYSAVGFSLAGLGYVGTGFTGNLTDVMYRFDPVANTWTQETSFPTGIRQWAVSCVSGNKAFLGTGNSTGGTLYSDWWEFTPAINGVNDLSDNGLALHAYFDNSQGQVIIRNSTAGQTVKIFDIGGKLVFEHSVDPGISGFSWNINGIFIMAITDKDKVFTTKFVCVN